MSVLQLKNVILSVYVHWMLDGIDFSVIKMSQESRVKHDPHMTTLPSNY